MPTYEIAMKDEPGDTDSEKATPVVRLTADTPRSPITAVEKCSDGDMQEHLTEVAQDALREYEKATNQKMTPSQMVRVFGQSAILTEGTK